MEEIGATSLLVTEKDEVKMLEFKLPLSVMQLELEIKNKILDEIDRYIKNEKKNRGCKDPFRCTPLY